MEEKKKEHKGAGHRQRLREKFMERGLESFRDDEVLELLLTIATPRRDCKDAARALLKHFGSLAGALEASQAQLNQVEGVGPKNSFGLHFVHAVARRYLKQRLEKKQYLKSSRQVADYLVHSMRDLKVEVLTVIYLDAGYGIIDSEVLTQGTLTSSTVHPRELAKAALAHHAAAVVIAHNHPSGNLRPSADDRHLTRNLCLALSLLNIRLLDHFIVAGTSSPYSFADHGLMAEIQEECAKLLG